MNTPDDSLVVDIGNPEDVRDKLPRACQIYLHKEKAADEAVEKRDAWRDRIELFARITGIGPADLERLLAPRDSPKARVTAQPEDTEVTAAPEGASSVVDLIVEIVERAGRMMNVADIRRIANDEGHELTSEAAANALSYATRRGRIKRPKRGFYAPLDDPGRATEPSEAQQNPFLRGVESTNLAQIFRSGEES